MIPSGLSASGRVNPVAMPWVGGAASAWAASTVAIPAHAAGDLLVIVAASWNASTIPTAPDDWTTVLAQVFPDGTGVRVAQKLATSTSDPSGTWTADTLFPGVWRGPTTIGAAAAASDDTGYTAAPPALTLARPGLSRVATLGAGTLSGGVPGTPSGMTSRTAGAWWRWADTDTPVATFASPSGAAASLSVSIELAATAAGGLTAAERSGWGTPIVAVEMIEPDLLSQPGWLAFDGPGYQGKGIQSPSQVTISDGIMTITGTPAGLTGAVGFYGATQRYGRWEARIRVPVTDTYGLYHPVALLWPESGEWPAAGEIDYFETSTEAGIHPAFSLHHGGSGSPVVWHSPVSDTGWHTWAVEWLPDRIVAYVDGIEYGRTTDLTQLPPGPMWHALQLDWIPWTTDPAAVDVRMEIDWLRIYSV